MQPTTGTHGSMLPNIVLTLVVKAQAQSECSGRERCLSVLPKCTKLICKLYGFS